jgi:hypothetical protein
MTRFKTIKDIVLAYEKAGYTVTHEKTKKSYTLEKSIKMDDHEDRVIVALKNFRGKTRVIIDYPPMSEDYPERKTVCIGYKRTSEGLILSFCDQFTVSP